MAGTVEYHDENLHRLFESLEPKRRIAAFKAAFRAEARRVRKVAVGKLRASVKSNTGLEKGIRAAAFRRVAGFKVTIGSKVKKTKKGRTKDTWTGFSFHRNRKGKEKPVLIWLEGGTEYRKTSNNTPFWAGGSWHKGKNRGRIAPVRFMESTKREVAPSVTANTHDSIRKYIAKYAEKYGAKLE